MRLFTTLALCLFAASVHADYYPTQKGVDVTPAVKYFQQFVHTLSRPTYVWSWFDAGVRSQAWRENFPANDGMALLHVQNSVPIYWEQFCSHDDSQNPPNCAPDQERLKWGTDNYYGPGLYAAVDPVITSGYGNPSNGNWVLLQLKMPVGARVIDTMIDSTRDMPDEVANLFQSQNCNGYPGFSAIFSGHMSAQCNLLIRRIFKDELQIDAFSYEYDHTDFKECRYDNDGNSDDIHGQAFVITSTKMFENYGADAAHRGEVLAFTKNTTDATPDRIRIESFFYKAMSESRDYQQSIITANLSKTGVPGHKNFIIANVYYDDSNKWYYVACPSTYWNDGDDSKCLKSTLVPASAMKIYPNTLSGKAKIPNFDAQEAIWPDLDGKSTDPNLEKWMTNNLYHCATKADMQ